MSLAICAYLLGRFCSVPVERELADVWKKLKAHL